MRLGSLLFFILCFFHSIFAADTTNTANTFVLRAAGTREKIVIDGELNEGIWHVSEKASTFQEHWPQNARAPLLHTEAMITADDNFIYAAFTCYDPDKNYVIKSLKRDFELDGNDAVSVLFDPAGQKNTAYFFSVSPTGVQGEALLNRFDFDANWDSKWYSAVKSYNDRWTVEIAIPFHILRYDPGVMTWNVNFMRSDVKHFRFYTWTKIPQQFDVMDLGYPGKLEWIDALPKKGGQVTLIPYTNVNASTDFEDPSLSKNKVGFGGDAKITLTSNLNLDLTANPDFSQVEVDRQVTNLTRFNVFFPERRNFFLENADLFSQFGDPSSPIFFSRRIGLDEDGRQVPILGGVRLTGNMGDSWRIGALNMQTKKTKEQPGQNYSAVTLHKKLLKRSLIKGLFTNRQAMDGNKFSENDYGRNASVEMIYQTEEGSFLSWLGMHKSYKQNYNGDDHMLSTGIWYNKTNFSSLLSVSTVGTNYTADMGFVNLLDQYDAQRDTTIRHGFHSVFHNMQYSHRTPNHKTINNHSFSVFNDLRINPGIDLLDWNIRLNYSMEFKSSSELEITLLHNTVNLLYPFSFTEDGTPLPKGQYRYNNFNIEFQSDVRKRLGFQVESNLGGFYNGNLRSIAAGVSYRAQPWGNFEFNIEYNDLDFPDAYGREKLLLINPRIEFNFSKNLFWTTFLQYNTQGDNFNINSRFQWRYKPMSDLYIVYTDNYAVKFWGPKNRTLVVKMNYWLNL